MTVWKINPAVPPAKGGMDDGLLDLMSALDALPTEKRSAPASKKSTAPKAVEPPAFVQMWFPRAIVCHFTHQDCACGQQWDSINGLYLEDQHRNGALRQTRVEANVVPPEYYGLPTRQQSTAEAIPFCAICFQTSFKVPEPELPQDLVRELTQEDRNELAQMVEESPAIQEKLSVLLENLNEAIAGGAMTEAEADAEYDAALAALKGAK